jgi:thioredoxin 1
MIAYVNNLSEFDQALEANHYVLCNFTASWCGPCRGIAPILEEMAIGTPQVKFIKVDVDENEETAHKHGIRAMPTFMLFKDGDKISESVGANPAAIKNMLKTV